MNYFVYEGIVQKLEQVICVGSIFLFSSNSTLTVSNIYILVNQYIF